jgi:hypothetical protein
MGVHKERKSFFWSEAGRMTPTYADILATIADLQAATWQTAEDQSANGQHSLAAETAARATGVGQALAAVKALAVRTKEIKADFEKLKLRDRH